MNEASDSTIVSRWQPRERGDLFRQTAAELNSSPIAIEKDYWVCWTLRHVFKSARRSSLVFKGGTSLSKVHHLIARFSEDIDLSLDRHTLGFQGDRDPVNASSRNKALQLVKQIPAACESWVSKEFVHQLRLSMREDLDEAEVWSLDPDDAERATLILRYPPSHDSQAYSIASYIRPQIQLEFGARNEVWPASEATVRSYCAEVFANVVPDAPSNVRVLSAERTFWEKATLAHALYHHQADMAAVNRLSRHYYDLAMLVRGGIATQAVANSALREAVVEHKSLFFASAAASYATARPGTFRIVPHSQLEEALRSDYAAMRDMFFEVPLSFDSILADLTALEQSINAR